MINQSNRKNISIWKRIFFSHISIVLISLLLTAVVFNQCLRIYIKNDTKSQLVSASTFIEKYMRTDTLIENKRDSSVRDDKEAVKSLLKISRQLKKTQTFLDINYAVIEKSAKVITVNGENNGEDEMIQKYIGPVLRQNVGSLEMGKKKLIYFKNEGTEYSALVQPLKLDNRQRTLYLVLYSDLKKSRELTFVVNIILLSILLIATTVALLISYSLSKKLSKPIIQLNKYAKQIGEREYNAVFTKYNEDEIGQLADTMQGMAQKLAAYDSTMKIFLQNASHELRTPLMSIQGYAEGIKYDVVDNRDSAVEIIIEESKRLSGIVEDLLYLTKIDAMQETLNLEELQAVDLVRSAIERVNGIALQCGKVITLTSKDSSIKFLGDEEKLIRALINILGNCLRYAQNHIELALKQDGAHVSIIITDDGTGFEKETLGNVFDRFFKGKGGNFGLGLAITKSIIDKHHGSITTENKLEGGACFTIHLPIL